MSRASRINTATAQLPSARPGTRADYSPTRPEQPWRDDDAAPFPFNSADYSFMGIMSGLYQSRVDDHSRS